MDWVHCNDCYIQPGDVEMKKFFITNCGHIFCDECLQMNQTNECRICHCKYTTIPLTSNMNSDIEIYFHDPIVNLKKQIKILEFQQNHRIRLVSHNRDRIRGYKTLKKENYNLSEELNLFKQENLTLREEIKKFKEDLLQFRKKCEFPITTNIPRSSQNTQKYTFSQFLGKDIQRMTPKLETKILGSNEEAERKSFLERNFNPTKRPPTTDFFVMAESKPSVKENRPFTTPDLPRFSGSYRNSRVVTPDIHTPPTPDSIIRNLSQRDPLQRKIKLPGSKSGPSPASKVGLHGLTLSRPTSTPNKNGSATSKYLKFFK